MINWKNPKEELPKAGAEIYLMYKGNCDHDSPYIWNDPELKDAIEHYDDCMGWLIREKEYNNEKVKNFTK